MPTSAKMIQISLMFFVKVLVKPHHKNEIEILIRIISHPLLFIFIYRTFNDKKTLNIMFLNLIVMVLK